MEAAVAAPCPECGGPLQLSSSAEAGLQCDGACGRMLTSSEPRCCCEACDIDFCIPCSRIATIATTTAAAAATAQIGTGSARREVEATMAPNDSGMSAMRSALCDSVIGMIGSASANYSEVPLAGTVRTGSVWSGEADGEPFHLIIVRVDGGWLEAVGVRPGISAARIEGGVEAAGPDSAQLLVELEEVEMVAGTASTLAPRRRLYLDLEADAAGSAEAGGAGGALRHDLAARCRYR